MTQAVSDRGNVFAFGIDLEDAPLWYSDERQQKPSEWIGSQVHAMGREGAGKRVRITFEVID